MNSDPGAHIAAQPLTQTPKLKGNEHNTKSSTGYVGILRSIAGAKSNRILILVSITVEKGAA